MYEPEAKLHVMCIIHAMCIMCIILMFVLINIIIIIYYYIHQTYMDSYNLLYSKI